MKILKILSKYVYLEPGGFWRYEDCWQKYRSKLECDNCFMAEINRDTIGWIEETSYPY